MKKKTLLMLMLPAFLWTSADSTDAQTPTPKNREYYIAQNDNVNYPDAPNTVIQMSTAYYDEEDNNELKYNNFGNTQGSVYLDGFRTNTAWGVWFTILAMLETPVVENGVTVHGYAVAGRYKENYTQGGIAGFASRLGGQTSPLPDVNPRWDYTAHDDAENYSLTIPKYIFTNKSQVSPLASQYRDKTLKVVGLDYSGLYNAREVQIILPSSITYIGYSSLGYTGGKTYPRKLAFYEGDGYKTTLVPGSDYKYEITGSTGTIYDDPTTAKWQELNNIEYLGDYACTDSYYRSLEDVVVPGKLLGMGEYCFTRSQNLTSVSMSEAEYPIFDWKFSKGIFSDCYNIASATITAPTQPVKICDEAFANNSSLTTVNFPTLLDSIGASAFIKCVVLNNVVLPNTNTLTNIGAQAFKQCSSLDHCILAPSVRTIQQQAFESCNFTGRFDIPTHIRTIEQSAYFNNPITYLPIPEIPANQPLRMGSSAFGGNQCDLTVECFTTTPPNIIMENERTWQPFRTWAINYLDTYWSVPEYRLRLLVPIGSVESYLNDETTVFNHYAHADYRVKFDLQYSYNKPQYGETGHITTAPWYVASSAWANDIYTFQPYHGGSVDVWTKTTGQVNQEGVAKDLWSATMKYAYSNEYEWEMGDYVKKDLYGDITIFPRTAHKYHNNEDVDDIPKIATVEVADGIVPNNVGILLAYTEPHIYLVPALDDWTMKYTSECMAQDLREWNFEFGYFEDNQYSEQIDSVTLHTLDGGLWADIDDRAGQSQIQYKELQSDGTYKAPVWINIYDYWTLTWNYETDSEVTITIDGVEYPKYEMIDYKLPVYRLPATIYWNNPEFIGAPDEGTGLWDGYLNTPVGYLIDSKWKEAWNESNTSAVITTEIDGTGYTLNDLFPNGKWFNLNNIRTMGEPTDQYNREREYTRNHFDRGNVLVPCVERTYIYPYWQSISEVVGSNETAAIMAEYNRIKAIRADSVNMAANHYKEGDEWIVDSIPVVGRRTVELTADGDYGDGFITFGLNNGCFVQTKNPGRTQANRAYFRIHTARLHSKHKPGSQSATSRAIIVDESEIEEDYGITGISQVIPQVVKENRQGWYTIDGRRLNTQPVQRGMYIYNGRKVVIQ